MGSVAIHVAAEDGDNEMRGVRACKGDEAGDCRGGVKRERGREKVTLRYVEARLLSLLTCALITLLPFRLLRAQHLPKETVRRRTRRAERLRNRHHLRLRLPTKQHGQRQHLTPSPTAAFSPPPS